MVHLYQQYHQYHHMLHLYQQYRYHHMDHHLDLWQGQCRDLQGFRIDKHTNKGTDERNREAESIRIGIVVGTTDLLKGAIRNGKKKLAGEVWDVGI